MTSPRAACAGPAGRFAPPPRAETAGPTSSRPQRCLCGSLRLNCQLAGVLAIPALLAGQAVAQDAQVMCAPGERVLDQLLSRYGESPIGAGVSSDGSVIVTASPTTRSWTLLVSRPDGSLCLLGSGGGWTAIEPAAPRKAFAAIGRSDLLPMAAE